MLARCACAERPARRPRHVHRPGIRERVDADRARVQGAGVGGTPQVVRPAVPRRPGPAGSWPPSGRSRVDSSHPSPPRGSSIPARGAAGRDGRMAASGDVMLRITAVLATVLLFTSAVPAEARQTGQAPAARSPWRAADGVTVDEAGDPQYSTFSLCAIDPATGQSGAAVTTRVPFVGRAVPRVRAGMGAVCTQASTMVEFGARGFDLIEKGVEPRTSSRSCWQPMTDREITASGRDRHAGPVGRAHRQAEQRRGRAADRGSTTPCRRTSWSGPKSSRPWLTASRPPTARACRWPSG